MSEPDRLVETHSAQVLMVGDRVYKWKKPLDLGFADFRTLASREQACQQELSLNRRLAPDVYLGLDTLRRDDGSVREHVVVMQRMPGATRLSTLVTNGEDVTRHLHSIARLLGDFHSRCDVSLLPDDVAGPRRLGELWDIGLDALTAAGPLLLEQDAVDEARILVHAYLDGREPLLAERIARGLVRDGHGDLLADDIFCLPDGPRVLDCLDFDPGLRHGDVLGDVATLVMDLERLGSPGGAEQLLTEYGEFSGEHHPASLAHLYVAYRAQVRAKVALIRRAQSADPAVRDAQLDQARQLVRLMVKHLRQGRVSLVLVGGLPGSGKSTVADGLAQSTGSLVLSSDLVRIELALPAETRYSPAGVNDVYAVLLGRARRALQQGWTVVLDASWTSAEHREAAVAVAAATGSRLVQLRCEVSDAVAGQRLARRDPHHPSDADAAVRQVLAAASAPWPDALPLPTDDAPAVALGLALAAVRDAPTAAP